MESIRDAVIAERSCSVSDAMMRTIPKSIKRLSYQSRSPRTHGGSGRA